MGLLLFTTGSSLSAVAQTAPSELPKPSELKALSYQKISQLNDVSSFPSYQDLVNTMGLAEAYSQGNRLLPNYQEPIVTRGNSGITVFRNASPSVALIVVGDVKNKQFDPTAFGAGVVINSSGDILTNWHVINGYSGAVIFFKPVGSADIDSSTAYAARVIAQNETSDLALLQLTKSPPGVASISIGNISSVQVAEDIHVIGHPNGKLWSYSTGVVSQIRNDYSWSYSDGSKHEAKVLQLQTAINPGNSGGPVLDDQGKLLGLIAMSEEGQNLDYAVAADVIQNFVAKSVAPTRSGGSEDNSPKAVYSSGHLENGSVVLRATFSDLTEYIVTEATGKTLALSAESADGTTLLAWTPNSSGGFSEWSITLPEKSVVYARGSGVLPDRLSSK